METVRAAARVVVVKVFQASAFAIPVGIHLSAIRARAEEVVIFPFVKLEPSHGLLVCPSVVCVVV
jgi:hypothetical protein